MGSYQFSTFKAYLKLMMGQRKDVENVGSTNMYEVWINAAYKDIATKKTLLGTRAGFYFPQLETVDDSQSTTDGTAYVDVPSDCLTVRQIYDATNDRELSYIPPQTYFGYTDRSDTSAEGQPTEWTRHGTKIYLHPTPDDSYTLHIYYKMIPSELSNPTDTTVLDDAWDEPILYLAAYKACVWLPGKDEDAKKYKEAFLDQVAGLVGLYDSEEEARTGRFKPSIMYREGGYE